MSITRRHLIATSGAGLAAGGAAAVLSACGGDARPEPSAERDVELLQRALGAEAAVANVYEIATGQALDPGADAAVSAFGEEAEAHLGSLTEAIEAAGGTAGGESGETFEQGESVIEAIALRLAEAIATDHEIVGDLSTVDARRAVYGVMTADAAQLAAIRGILGEEQVPAAFVTGSPEPPLSSEDDVQGDGP